MRERININDLESVLLFANKYLGYDLEDMTYLKIFIDKLYNLFLEKMEDKSIKSLLIDKLTINEKDLDNFLPEEKGFFYFQENNLGEIKQNILVSRIYNVIADLIDKKLGLVYCLIFALKNDYYLNYERNINMTKDLESYMLRSRK